MSSSEQKADAFFDASLEWHDEFLRLRSIVLRSGLEEEFKWGHPCYTVNGKNIVLIHGFKDYCALLFFKGALLPDEQGILVQQTENVQSPRQVRFTSVDEIADLEAVLEKYILNAIGVEKAGLRVEPKKTEEYPFPDELRKKMEEIPALKAAFEALTPGRQRAYLFYFSSAKQSKTRMSRIDNHLQRILDGKGMDD